MTIINNEDKNDDKMDTGRHGNVPTLKHSTFTYLKGDSSHMCFEFLLDWPHGWEIAMPWNVGNSCTRDGDPRRRKTPSISRLRNGIIKRDLQRSPRQRKLPPYGCYAAAHSLRSWKPETMCDHLHTRQ